MVTFLLESAGRPLDQGIRPHIPKVPTISVLMTGVAKCQSNLSQLAIQGNYRSATAHDMAKVYSRNLAHRQLFASDVDQNAFKNNASLESVKMTNRPFWWARIKVKWRSPIPNFKAGCPVMVP